MIARVGRKLEQAIAILNGAVGDHLARSENGLATPLTAVHEGHPLPLARLTDAHPTPSPRVVVLLHGLMCTEDIWTFPDGRDYGRLLAADFGYTPIYLRYNTGLAVQANGFAFARFLDELVARYPVPLEEILLLGYSMGGLVVRNACHFAETEGHAWLSRVKTAFYVATPHRGAPLERAGRVLTRLLATIPDPITRLAADLGDLRSQGIQDLGDPRHPITFLPDIQHYLVAGALANAPWLTELFGDTMVPISSGTDGHRAGPRALPPTNVKVLAGLSHMDLAHHPDVYAQLHEWLRQREATP